jgi:LEA14-like dessication related protein
MPQAGLLFDRIEAESLTNITLFYRFNLRNTRDLPLTFKIHNWKLRINGEELGRHETKLLGLLGPIELPGNAENEEYLALELDLDKLSGGAGPEGAAGPDEYKTELVLELSNSYPGSGSFSESVSAPADFPRIRAPEFTITSIAILQAELINTRFRVSLRIDNPNIFPVALSAFNYELYGEGRFWADGRVKDVLRIPARGSEETNLYLLMNFINMKRPLLDEVIAQELVQYRFDGSVDVGTEVAWLPNFHMDFDRSGKSIVLK